MPTATRVSVVDASAIAAILFGEPEGEAVAQFLAGSRLVAPALLAFELANVCLIKMRRHPHRQEALFEALQLRERMALEEAMVDAAGVVRLAAETGLTAYDASYLWLARELGADLITLDQQLAQAGSTSLANRPR